jgi:xanthine dehydrogenase molybdenum-binding subunit
MHTGFEDGNFDEAIQEEGLVEVDGWYETPMVQHCHIERPFPCVYGRRADRGSIPTQIPHITRRVVAQALDLPWGKVRIIKPYIGGGFGNKQDVLYEPLNAYLCKRWADGWSSWNSRARKLSPVRACATPEFHLTSYVRPTGVSRRANAWSIPTRALTPRTGTASYPRQ